MKIHNPFRTALVATLGVGLGILLINSVENLSTVLLYLGTALFLSLGLDPLVSFLERRRLPRWAAVLVTILAVLGVFAGIVLIVLPVLALYAASLPGGGDPAIFMLGISSGVMFRIRSASPMVSPNTGAATAPP